MVFGRVAHKKIRTILFIRAKDNCHPSLLWLSSVTFNFLGASNSLSPEPFFLNPSLIKILLKTYRKLISSVSLNHIHKTNHKNTFVRSNNTCYLPHQNYSVLLHLPYFDLKFKIKTSTNHNFPLS